MNKGSVEQIGTPAEIYDHPASAFVMSFIGFVNVLPSTSGLFQSNGFDSAHPSMFLRPQDVIIETVANGKGKRRKSFDILYFPLPFHPKTSKYCIGTYL